MRKIQITINQDLYNHLEAMKLYFGYRRMSEVVIKALDEMINKNAGSDVFQFHLSEIRKNTENEDME